MVSLAPDDLGRIEAAIRRAEALTAGEIVVVVSRQAASYRSAALAATLLAALVAPWPLALLTRLTMPEILLGQIVTALAVLAVTQVGEIRRRLVPSSVRHRRGREAAERAFASCGLARTSGRTGILLYVSLAERHAEVIGDDAIAALVPDEIWRGLVERLVATAARDGIASGIVEAVGEMGAVLAAHVPPEPVPADELPNRVVLL